MNYQEAIELLGSDFDKDGYTKKQMRSESRSLWIVNTRHAGLRYCTHDWPAPYRPSIEDKQATDWIIYDPQITHNQSS